MKYALVFPRTVFINAAAHLQVAYANQLGPLGSANNSVSL